MSSNRGVSPTTRAQPRATEPGKNLYTVFPKQGTDTAATVEFIKSTVRIHDLHPWTGVDEQLISWTVEASPSEVTALEGYNGIVRVIKLQIPADHDKLRQEDPPTEEKYIIYPLDRQNLDQCNETGVSLKALLHDKIQKPRMDGEMVRKWVAFLTIDQVEQVERIDGVRLVTRVHKGRRCRMARGLSKPSTPPKLSDPLKKRDITYETQKNAVPELIAISQPSTIPVLKDLKDYIYESNAGGKSYVYHIETGVAFKGSKQGISKRCPTAPPNRGRYREP